MVAPYTYVEKDTVGYVSGVYGIFIKPDGTRLYIPRADLNVRQYSMTPPWSAANIVGQKNSPAIGGDTNDDPTGVFFKPDGSRMFVICPMNDYIKQFNLPTPWDVGTITAAGQTPELSLGYGLFFSPDGMNVYSNRYVNGFPSTYYLTQFPLGTAWDVSTAGSRIDRAFSGTSLGGEASAISASSDGKRFYVSNLNVGSELYLFELATPWDITTATLIGKDWENSDYPGLIDSQTYAHFMAPSEDKLYVFGYDNSVSQSYVALFSATPPPEPIWWTNFRGQSEIV